MAGVGKNLRTGCGEHMKLDLAGQSVEAISVDSVGTRFYVSVV